MIQIIQQIIRKFKLYRINKIDKRIAIAQRRRAIKKPFEDQKQKQVNTNFKGF